LRGSVISGDTPQMSGWIEPRAHRTEELQCRLRTSSGGNIQFASPTTTES